MGCSGTTDHVAERPRRARLATSGAVGVGAALVGLTPWLVTGARLPLQNLWARSTAQMPVGLLPFSQYELVLVVGLIVTGSGLAGGVVRVTGRAFALVAVVVGVLVAQTIALVQTAAVVHGGLRTSGLATVYLAALVGWTLAAMAVGLLVLLLLARTSVPGATVAMALAAPAVGHWLAGVVAPAVAVGTVISAAMRWMPAVLVGAAVAWCGFAVGRRVAASIAALLLVWVLPAAFAALDAAAGSRAMLGEPLALVVLAVRTFVAMLVGVPDGSLPLLVGAVVVAGVGLTVQAARERELETGTTTRD